LAGLRYAASFSNPQARLASSTSVISFHTLLPAAGVIAANVFVRVQQLFCLCFVYALFMLCLCFVCLLGGVSEALEPLLAWDAPFGSELQGRLPQPRDSLVNALLCFCSGLASSEGNIDARKDVVSETTSWCNVPKSLLLALYYWLILPSFLDEGISYYQRFTKATSETTHK
jgi:hypothetical protein